MNNICMRQTDYEGNCFQEGVRQQFLANPEVFAAYRNCLNDGISQACFENTVYPEFYALHRKILQTSGFPYSWPLQTLMVCRPRSLRTIVTPGDVRENASVHLNAEELACFLFNIWQFLLRTDRRLRVKSYITKGGEAYLNRIVHPETLLSGAAQTRRVNLLVRGFSSEENRTYVERKYERHPFPEPAYGFVRRDLDVLAIEKRLLSRGNHLLVCAKGGAGKTTLLNYIGAWWQTTRFVDQVFYFDYDKKAWTRGQIMTEIAERLLTSPEFANFQFLSEEIRQAVLCEKLSEERHLLILDNMESATEPNLPARNTLSETDQEELRQFLTELDNGESLVLIGSRDKEKWLAKKTFGDNVYKLPGLDPRNAFTFADRILKKHKIALCHEDADFQKLLELSGGYPLALEVILPDLKQQTAGDILKALEADNLNPDNGDTQSKTETILRSIEYLYSSLAPDARDIVNCLAPFTSVINGEGLKRYVRELRKQSALAHLPFDDMPEIIQQGTDRELFSPHPHIPAFMKIEPVLSYFLKNRPYTPDTEEKRHAAETGFRQYYDNMAQAVYHLMVSKGADKKVLSHILIRPEYENLTTALNFSLNTYSSVGNLYRVLSNYLVIMYKNELRHELGNRVLTGLEGYPGESLEDAEFVEIVADIGSRQLLTGQYPEAEQSYQKALGLWLQNKQYDADQIKRKSGVLYHQLGRVAQEQKQWKRAREYFLKDLQISSEYKDMGGMRLTLHNLLRLWISGRDNELPEAVTDK